MEEPQENSEPPHARSDSPIENKFVQANKPLEWMSQSVWITIFALIVVGGSIWKWSSNRAESPMDTDQERYQVPLDEPQRIARNYRARMRQGTTCEMIANEVDAVSENGMDENSRYMQIKGLIEGAARAGCI